MAIPVFTKFLPAAKFAYDHRDKAINLYKNIQNWRSKDNKTQESLTIDITSELTVEEQVNELREMIFKRDEIITQQSNLLAKLANDVSELSTLTDRLRRRSQWLIRGLYLLGFIYLIRWIFF